MRWVILALLAAAVVGLCWCFGTAAVLFCVFVVLGLFTVAVDTWSADDERDYGPGP